MGAWKRSGRASAGWGRVFAATLILRTLPIFALGTLPVLVLGTLPGFAQQAAQKPTPETLPGAVSQPRGTEGSHAPPAAEPPATQKAPAGQQLSPLAMDTAKLWQLATDLKSEVDKTTKDTLSIPVIRKADEVEKLAHAMRQKAKAEGVN